MRKALEGFIVDDRRGEPHNAPEPDNVEIVERIDGAECVSVMRGGRKVLIRRGGHDVAHLAHRFARCICDGHEIMLIGDEPRPDQCNQTDWGWQAHQGMPAYSTGTRTFTRATRMEPDPVAENQRLYNLDGLSRLIGFKG